MTARPSAPRPSPSSDAARADLRLVERVLDGERDCFAPLMRRYNQRVYRAVRAIVRDDHEAEDVTQQAYVLAYRKLAQFRGQARFGTWLTRIAVHEALSRRRVRTRRGDVALIEPDHQSVADSGPSPEEAAARRELAHLLESHVDALPEAYRTVFVLREVEELDTAETAECLNLSPEAVRVRLHRARHLLQSSLTEAVGLAAPDAFRFDGERCDRIVAGVMAQIEQ